MNDYYRILQVHHEAEPEVIEAAYRRLMRKYHPDVLPPELRNDPEVLQKAKDINEAYEILSTPVKRAEYDKRKNSDNPAENSTAQKNPSGKIQHKSYEKSFLFVRCGQTKEVFKALLVRELNTKKLFVLVGFEPAPEYSTPEKSSVLNKISHRFNKNNLSQSLTATHNSLDIDSLSDEDIHKQLTDPPSITMGDIDWGQHTCPACAGSIQNENGTKATWVGCANCGRIRCAGGIKDTNLGRFSTCPWCGKTNKLTRSVPTGKKDHLQLHGYEKQKETHQKQKKLPSEIASAKLPKGEKD